MGTKKLIENIKSSLGLKDLRKEGKKKSLKSLLNKLNMKKVSIEKSLETSLGKKENKELQEDLDIVSLQIKKGERLLTDLSLK